MEKASNENERKESKRRLGTRVLQVVTSKRHESSIPQTEWDKVSEQYPDCIVKLLRYSERANGTGRTRPAGVGEASRPTAADADEVLARVTRATQRTAYL